jgi:hypothetical protein
MYFSVDRKSAAELSRNGSRAFPESCPEPASDCRWVASYAVHDHRDQDLEAGLRGLRPFTTYALFVRVQNVYGMSRVRFF